jgi:uracil-DNA glycosylase family 4
MAVNEQGGREARAYLEYFRDMGVYEFYRNGEPAAMAETEVAAVTPVAAAPVVQAEALLRMEAAPLQAEAPKAASVPAPITAPASVDAPDFNEAGDAIPKLISFNDLAPMPGARVVAADRPAALAAIQAEIGDCTRCPLAYGGRRNIVFGDGDPNARLMFVGEGPGADEDAQGLPFVGKSGQLLNNMIAAMGLKREEVYVANIVKCRPPSNRAPEYVEATTCTQFLVRQMDVVRPEYVVALGSTAATYLLGVKQSLASLRGRFHDVRGAKGVVTFHPAFLLRDPRQKVEAWKDLQMVMKAMGLKGAK